MLIGLKREKRNIFYATLLYGFVPDCVIKNYYHFVLLLLLSAPQCSPDEPVQAAAAGPAAPRPHRTDRLHLPDGGHSPGEIHHCLPPLLQGDIEDCVRGFMDIVYPWQSIGVNLFSPNPKVVDSRTQMIPLFKGTVQRYFRPSIFSLFEPACLTNVLKIFDFG